MPNTSSTSLPQLVSTNGTSTPTIRNTIDTSTPTSRSKPKVTQSGGGGDDETLRRISALETVVNNISVDIGKLHTNVSWLIRIGGSILGVMIFFSAWLVVDKISYERTNTSDLARLTQSVDDLEKKQMERDHQMDLRLQTLIDKSPKK